MLVAGTFAADYGRNRVVLRLLERNGYDVRLAHFPLWGTSRHTLLDTSKWRLARRALTVYPRLFAAVLFGPRADVVLVLYPGQLDVPVVKLAALLRRAPVVFDVFILLHETAVADRRLRAERSATARLLALADRLACRCADVVLADTPADAEYFSRTTGVVRERMRVLWVGGQDDLFHPLPDVAVQPRRVFFHGTYIPLHGIDTIVRAAKLLEHDDLSFFLLGDGQERGAIEALMRTLEPANVQLLDPVPLEKLAHEIAASAVCLGIFGTTAKAARVVPNKVFEYVAVGRPVITAGSPAIDSAFDENEILTVPAGDAHALAGAIRALLDDPSRAAEVAAAGHHRFRRDYGEEPLAALLDSYLRELWSG